MSNDHHEFNVIMICDWIQWINIFSLFRYTSYYKVLVIQEEMKVLILSLLVAVCYAQTPARPVIPETFEAEVRINNFNPSFIKGLGTSMSKIQGHHRYGSVILLRFFYNPK